MKTDETEFRSYQTAAQVVHRWPEFIRALADGEYRGAFVYETDNTNEDRVKGLLEIIGTPRQ